MLKTTKKSTNGTSSSAFTTSLTKLMTSATALQGSLKALDLPALTAEERLHSDGRLRQGEAAAMTAIFDAMDASPTTFASLADKDGGTDDAEVETGPARQALTESQALAPLAALLEAMHTLVSDAMLATASQAKAVSVPAYAIGKANAASNATVRKTMAAAINYYGTQGRRKVLATTKQANAAKKAAKKAKVSTTAS